MPRRARLRLAACPTHLIQRGNNKGACFFSPEDYVVYLEFLARQAEKFSCAVHAYVLMTNHVHLLLTPSTADGPSLLMKHLGQRYVQYVNRTYRRSGTLWEGRFRSSIVQEQAYLLRCHQYIELNPVRAKMVRHARDYLWSSYCSNAESQRSALLTPHPEYLALGTDSEQRRNAYRELFQLAFDAKHADEIRQAANSGFALGDSRFKAEIGSMLKRRVERGVPGRPPNKPQRFLPGSSRPPDSA